MSELKITYPWRTRLAQLVESGQTRSVVLSGNVSDLFYVNPDEAHPNGRYVNLTEHLATEWGRLKGNVLVILKIDGTIQFLSGKRHEGNLTDEELIARAWASSETEEARREAVIERFIRPHATDRPEPGPTFTTLLRDAQGKPAEAISLLQEICRLSRQSKEGSPLFKSRLLILVENADLLLPEGQIHTLGAAYQSRILQMREWFADPEFGRGQDVVILVSESKSQINHRVVRLPQVLTCEIPFPDETTRMGFIEWFDARDPDSELQLWGTKQELAQATEALDLHALHQLLLAAHHARRPLTLRDVDKRVEAAIQKLVGTADDGSQVVRFYRPTHTRADLVGLSPEERTADEELMRRYQSRGKDALSNTIVVGPIGGGKTFRFGAIASELGMPVLELGNYRSMWFGGTDIKLDRIRRVLDALSKVMMMLDEGDTQMGGLKEGTHETEQRATGTFQRWMSDPKYKGRVIWLQLSARPQRYSADLKRKGRGGDLIYPVFDPVDDQLDEVIEWMLKPSMQSIPGRKTKFFKEVRSIVEGWSMGDLAHMRSELIAIATEGKLTQNRVLDRVKDELPGEIGLARRYQVLQALLHTTRNSLIPRRYLEGKPRVDDELRKKWRLEAQMLEAMGIN